MNQRVLIVEDNAVSAKTLELYLLKQGYDPILAQTGREALSRLTAIPDIQLVIADIMMPEMNGLEFLKNMRANPAWTAIPVIMSTALADVQTIKQAFEAGCQHYVVKPIKAAQLLQKIRETLEHEAQTLRDRAQVMIEVGLDAQAYDEVAQAFTEQLADTIAQLEQGRKEGAAQGMSLDLQDLWEGAALLGAEKVMRILERCLTTQGQAQVHLQPVDYGELLLELKLVQQFLVGSS